MGHGTKESGVVSGRWLMGAQGTHIRFTLLCTRICWKPVGAKTAGFDLFFVCGLNLGSGRIKIFDVMSKQASAI